MGDNFATGIPVDEPRRALAVLLAPLAGVLLIALFLQAGTLSHTICCDRHGRDLETIVIIFFLGFPFFAVAVTYFAYLQILLATWVLVLPCDLMLRRLGIRRHWQYAMVGFGLGLMMWVAGHLYLQATPDAGFHDMNPRSWIKRGVNYYMPVAAVTTWAYYVIAYWKEIATVRA